ncbi:hypothetical protein BUALT_Bualt18G0053900 [Buddleja alternifolia]|uniref:SWIM-type domain-containing protein n=1 Tax=Buddleja alternifolia TaxID=168488 RepID=A0AAV6W8E7_9LAMI|nr:hypothetical protein BUALT_Bualt18G0053900 [Buddleja alternifolia]
MWILRTYFDNEMEIGTSTKFCFHDDSSIFFTVKMHHSGRFVERGKSYIEEQINYFDWCDSSNMSMTDLRSMSRQLGHEQWVKFYYNVKSHDDCSQFILLVSDDCAQDLIRNVDNEGMVNIYVDHVQPEIGFQSQGGSNLPSSQYSNVFGSEIDQTGYFADEERFEGNGVEDASDKNHQSNPVESEILEVENETESEGSDTDEEDSVYSDGFADSDYDVDDALYEQYIDKEVEWEGIGATFSPDFEVENTIRRGKSRTLSKARVAMSKKRSQLPIYKGDADNSDFEWEVGLRFKIVVEFRDAIRTYSNKQEKYKTWEWFLELLIADLEIRNSFHYTVISDKQKGLIKAIDKLLPNSEHRFCLRHMYNNFKKDHKGLALKDMVWKAATAARIRPAVNWAKSHFSTWPKSDMLLNNLCESFNSVILKARDKPIIMMLETIRLILMKRIHHQRDTILKSKGEICPKVQKILEQNKRKSREYILEWNGRDQFEVKGCHGDKMIVSLSKRTCSCKKWELTGIPCVHATACIFHRRQKVEDFVENWYTKETFLKAYTNMLNPIHGMEEWPETNTLLIEPWVAKIKKTGRPLQHARRKENDELIIEQENGKTLKKGGSKNMCSICDGIGHNKSTCNKRPQDGQSSRPSKKKSKLPVKRRVIPSNDSNLVLQPETSAQDDEVRSRASETEIFKMTSNVMTQETDGNSTMTRD